MGAQLPTAKLSQQVVGNIGLYYVCYRLSRLGWNVMPTARNARGVDAVIYSQDGKRTFTIQVKALSKRAPVPLGGHLGNLIADFFVVCRYAVSESPECFVLTPAEVKTLAAHSIKELKESFWLQPKQYEAEQYHEAWSRIGTG